MVANLSESSETESTTSYMRQAYYLQIGSERQKNPKDFLLAGHPRLRKAAKGGWRLICVYPLCTTAKGP